MSSDSSGELSTSSSCSWAVLNVIDRKDGDTVVCSVCGLNVEAIYCRRPYCDFCILCESCQGLDFSLFPPCEHGKGFNSLQLSEKNSSLCKADSTNRECTKDCPGTEGVEDGKLTIMEKDPSQAVSGIEPESVPILDGQTSLTAHIMEALECATSPDPQPPVFSFMKSELTPSVCTHITKGLRCSSKATRLSNDCSHSPPSNPPNSTISTGLDESSTLVTGSNFDDHEKSSSVSTSSTTNSTFTSTGKSATANFLKSVAMHSTSTLNNFDCMPMDSCDDVKRKLVKNLPLPIKTSNASIKSKTEPQPLGWRSLAMDDAQLFELLKPKEVPKSVLEMASYNLR